MKRSAIACLVGAALVLCYGLLYAVPASSAAAGSPDVIFLPDWIGITGLLTFGGVLIQWGQMKRQSAETDREILLLRDLMQQAMPRREFETRLNRMEDTVNERFDKMDERFDETSRRFDALFQQLDVDRRHGPRGHHKEG